MSRIKGGSKWYRAFKKLWITAILIFLPALPVLLSGCYNFHWVLEDVGPTSYEEYREFMRYNLPYEIHDVESALLLIFKNKNAIILVDSVSMEQGIMKFRTTDPIVVYVELYYQRKNVTKLLMRASHVDEGFYNNIEFASALLNEIMIKLESGEAAALTNLYLVHD